MRTKGAIFGTLIAILGLIILIQVNIWIALSVFLLTWGNNIHRTYNKGKSDTIEGHLRSLSLKPRQHTPEEAKAYSTFIDSYFKEDK